jgi:hypothetical protein
MAETEWLYFACGWIIRPNVDYDLMRHYAEHAPAELVAINPIYRSEQGYMVQTFAVRVPSEEALVSFIEKAGEQFGLTHWYGVTVDYFERGTQFNLQRVLPYFREQWLSGMQTYGEYNQKLSDTLKASAITKDRKFSDTAAAETDDSTQD